MVKSATSSPRQHGTRRIAVVAPARRLESEAAQRLAGLAGEFDDVALVLDPQCALAHGHFAGADAERCAAFVAAANDPDIDAIWFARGGYGSFRLLPEAVSALEAPAWEKTYLGYSDIGALLAALYKAGVGHVVHGPMASDIMRANGEAAARRALGFLAHGETTGLAAPVSGGGPAAAFNITVLASLCGTPAMPDLSGHVLYLEEVGEYLYRVDRAMGQIMSQPFASALAGVYLGRVSDVPENDVDFGMDAAAIAAHWCARAGVAYLGRADIGHDADNGLVPFGKPCL